LVDCRVSFSAGVRVINDLRTIHLKILGPAFAKWPPYLQVDLLWLKGKGLHGFRMSLYGSRMSSHGSKGELPWGHGEAS
jgi:hypothetical protein